ncbi:MAG: hypothetical protein GF331_00140 [Chitinivibrionales bacterium]|nr:hypothetical protein [Chitinivibrionales bacterium]
MVEHDSIIPPGREGTITPKVSLKGMTRAFSKTIRVESNAANEPNLKLVMKGTIVPIIEVSPTYLSLQNGVALDKNPAVQLKTKKDNLKVTDIVFEATRRGPAGGFRSSLPILPTHTLTREKKPDKEGYYTYTLRLAVDTELDETTSGELRISTNHPDKPEITIRANIRGN